MKMLRLLGSIVIILFSCTLMADEISDKLSELGRSKFPTWLNNPVVIDAVKAQNAKNAGLSQADIDVQDKQWRAEVKSGAGPLVDATLGNALSTYLKKVKEDGQGLYTEIFVMDNKGLNVGQSDVTSDYWQGDEAKWQKTYLVGADAIHVSDVEQDESTQVFQAQVSLPVVDGGQVIGAVTVGVNVDGL